MAETNRLSTCTRMGHFDGTRGVALRGCDTTICGYSTDRPWQRLLPRPRPWGRLQRPLVASVVRWLSQPRPSTPV